MKAVVVTRAKRESKDSQISCEQLWTFVEVERNPFSLLLLDFLFLSDEPLVRRVSWKFYGQRKRKETTEEVGSSAPVLEKAEIPNTRKYERE